MASVIIKKLKFLFINTILIMVFLLIILITLHDRISMYSLRFVNSSFTWNTFDQCRLSLYESDDWFCESDSDWKRRKALHHLQDKRNRISDSRRSFFQN